VGILSESQTFLKDLEMDPLLRLAIMLSDFQSCFKHKNVNAFRPFVKGLINTP